MRIGILGSGLMGGRLGTLFARAGHEVVFSYARSEQKLKRLARGGQGNARPGRPREAAQEADAVLLAVHWSRMDDVLNQAGDLSGKVIVTCSLPMNDDNTALVLAHTSSGAEELAKMVPTARIVAAFNTVPSQALFGVYDARRKARRPSLVYYGDDERGKGVAAERMPDEEASREGIENMNIQRSGAQPSGKGPAEYFTGTVRIDPLFQAHAPARALGASVTFEPGARTAWHTHPLGQTLIVTAGCGRVQRWGGPTAEVRPGDVVWFPPGEKHWHGATATTAMTHIAIQEQLDGKAVDWMEQVSDEQYQA